MASQPFDFRAPGAVTMKDEIITVCYIVAQKVVKLQLLKMGNRLSTQALGVGFA